MRDAAAGRVTASITGPVAEIVLDRPAKLNALTLAMLEDLEDIIAELEDHRTDVRAVVLSGRGDRAFSVGADIREWSAVAARGRVAMWQEWDRVGHRVLDRLAALPMPVIAALRGLVLGGGLELALAADLRVASDDVELGLPEVGIAMLPGWGAVSRLRRLVGIGRSKQLIFTGQRIGVEVAADWGLVNEVVPADELMTRAQAVAALVASHAPLAVTLAKGVLDAGDEIGSRALIDGLAGSIAANSDDGREGVASFLERRRPEWTGS